MIIIDSFLYITVCSSINKSMNYLISLIVAFLAWESFEGLVSEECVIGTYNSSAECTAIDSKTPSNGHCSCTTSSECAGTYFNMDCIVNAGCPGVCKCKDNYAWGGESCVSKSSAGGGSGSGGESTPACSCPSGQICSGSSCSSCPAGTSPNAHKSACDKCAAGSYSSSSGSASCTQCAEDYFQNEAGKTQCKPCEEGSCQPKKGQTTCLKCHDYCTKCSKAIDNCSSCIANVGIEHKNNKCLCKTKARFYEHEEEGKLFCDPCYEFCKVCVKKPNYCLSCLSIPGVNRVRNQCLCNGKGYGLRHNVELGVDECFPCYPLCSSCYGFLSTECYLCDKDKFAIYVDPSTCICRDHYYFDSYLETCIPCHDLCSSCFGPSAFECDSCFNSFSVENKPWCTLSCYLLEGYYEDTGICRGKCL